MVDRQRHDRRRLGPPRRRPVDVVERFVASQRPMGRAALEEAAKLRPGRIFGRAQEARDGESAVGVGVGAAGFERLVAQPAAQKAGHEGVAGAEHVVDFDRKAWPLDALLERIGNGAGEHDATHRAALEHQRRLACGADRFQRGERVIRAAGDHHLLFGPDDEIALRQDGAQALRDFARLDVTLFARAMAREAPQVRPVIDVEHDLAAGGAGDAHRLKLRGGRVGAGEMRAAHQDRLGALDIVRIDVALVERAVGAIVAIEDEREGLFVADAEQHERGEPDRIGPDARNIDALARTLLTDEPAHVLVADTGDEAALQAQPRRADGDVGRAAADCLGERRHVLEPPADLRAIEVDRRAADGDDVQAGTKRHDGPAHGSIGGSLVPTTFWSKSMLAPVIIPDLSEHRKTQARATSLGSRRRPKGLVLTAASSQPSLAS